jgi:hypothetical protein
MRVLVWLGLAAGTVAAVSGIASAQSAAAEPKRRATAARIAEAPVIDGSVDENLWQQATVVTDFVQAEPVEGQPASERTEVRILYDERAIYIGVVCYDSEPSKIITTDSRRDSGLGDMDSFQMILDTYLDQQNGFVFGTNAVGTQYDAQVRNEGQSQGGGAPQLGRTSGGSGSGVNVNWDGAWDVKSRVTEIGWSAEFAIPLRTLRYGAPPQIWGLNFTRNIQRKRETVYWSPVSRIYNLTRLSSAGELRDLSVPTPRNLKVMPYALGSANRNFFTSTTNDYGGDFGADAKVGVTSSLNLDLTYNTDFAQVEVDEQQINLTRFNVLFPEKRPFFLENRGLFAVGKPGEVDLFFSRAIGISEDGDLVPILGGGRLTGVTSGLNVGVMNMQTDSVITPEGVVQIAANNYSALRVSKDLRNRTNFGGIFVNRSGTGSLSPEGDWNRTWGLDGRLGIGEAITFQGFGARTETPGSLEGEYAFAGGGEYRTRLFRTDFNYAEVAEDFNPEVGFLERSDEYRQMSTGFHYNLRSQGLGDIGFRELRPHITYESFWNFDGFKETATVHMDSHLDWENGNYFSPAVNHQYEGLLVPFEVYPGVVVPPGQYSGFHTAFAGNTDRRKALSFQGNWNYGSFLSGNQNVIVPSVTLRSGGTFSATLRWQRSDIDLPEGAFVTNLGTFRATYNFTTLINVQGLVQYNDRTSRWSTNLRFNWQQTAATGLYVVYNDTEAFDGLGPVNRAFIIKYSHMFDLLQ